MMCARFRSTMNEQELQLKEAKILYDAGGRPEFVLLPFEQVETLIKPKAPKNIYPLTDEQIVAAVDEVRSELFEKHYAGKIKNSS